MHAIPCHLYFNSYHGSMLEACIVENCPLESDNYNVVFIGQGLLMELPVLENLMVLPNKMAWVFVPPCPGLIWTAIPLSMTGEIILLVQTKKE